MSIEILGAAALALTVPGSLYLGAVTAAAALARPGGDTCVDEDMDNGTDALRVAIVVPAHNESAGVLRTLYSLAMEVALDPNARVVVVADNCSDDTAAVARGAGAQVLERQDPLLRGKGCALRHAFDIVTDADWFIVVDVDTDVAPGFLAAMRGAMVDGVHALQCRYGVRDPLASRRVALADVALGGSNVLHPRGRAALGLSAGILGNGFALSRRALQAVPYSACASVADEAYHHLLVRAGLRVHWVDGTAVRSDLPKARAAAGQQRARWEGGRLRLLKERGPGLLGQVLRGRWRQLGALLELLLLPLAWHVVLLLAALLLGSKGVRLGALAGLAGALLHTAVALVLIRARREHLRALLGMPLYGVWKLHWAMATWRASQRQAAWSGSARGAR